MPPPCEGLCDIIISPRTTCRGLSLALLPWPSLGHQAQVAWPLFLMGCRLLSGPWPVTPLSLVFSLVKCKVIHHPDLPGAKVSLDMGLSVPRRGKSWINQVTLGGCY